MIGTVHPVVEVEGFAGPFDLLARLIERRELDVLTISLAAVSEQYLEHLTELERRDPEHLSAFLVVAAKLLLIKSVLLLPASPHGAPPGPVEDPTDLTERLRIYQRYRAAGQLLANRCEAGLRSYAHVPPPYTPHPRGTDLTFDSGLLRPALLRAMARARAEPAPTPLGEAPYSVAEALAGVRRLLAALASVRFDELVAPDASRQRYVATFLAILEVARLGLASVSQVERFGEIIVRRAGPHPLPLSSVAGEGSFLLGGSREDDAPSAQEAEG